MSTVTEKSDSDDSKIFASTEEILEDVRNGKMIILVDAEDRENEGDLIVPAQMATPEAINFMAKFGRGLICLALTDKRARQLNLEMMARHNREALQTAFTVSIEAREGVTTGISAHDRAHTIAVAIDPTKDYRDIVTPGHVFPLVAREGGVLIRAGHTEAAVDLARLAGLYPAGVICEIMNDDGTMARVPDLIPFAQKHGLKIGTIADLIAYRYKHDAVVKVVRETTIDSPFGGAFKLKVYTNLVEPAEHIALVKGDVATDEPVLVRVHAFDVLTDVLGAEGHRHSLLQKSMEMIGEAGRGVVVLIRDVQADAISRSLARRENATTDGEQASRVVESGIGSQILRDLGVRNMLLLSNAPVQKKVVGLEGWGLSIAGIKPIE